MTMNIPITLQILDFKEEKMKQIEENTAITAIVLGDVSCLFRNKFFLQETLLNRFGTSSKEKWIQLPLVIKENEMKQCLTLIDTIKHYCDGFITGDLGVIAEIRKQNLPHKIIYTTNVLNKEFVSILKKYNITFVRPLMYKRTFIEEKIGFPKDIVVYGNMMINAATFCPYSEHNLVENCQFGCKQSRDVLMHNEKLHLIGRSLFTENKLNLISRIPYIQDLKNISIMDYSLTNEELQKTIENIHHEITKSIETRN